MGVYIITAIILIFYLLLAWFVGSFFQLQGASLWILRCGLAFIGLAAAGFYLWFHHRLKRREAGMVPPSAAGLDQITFLLKQADQKLRRSKQRKLSAFPVVFILGESKTAKTSTVMNGGLEAELLAGHVLHDGEIVPTSTVNIWFARDTIFIEAGAQVAGNQQMWTRLLQHTSPGRFSAALGRGHQAPRAVLVCVGCDHLGGAQNLGSRLKEMAHSLGAAFPVYVLFTKLDRVPYYTEFVSNLTSEETAQILGATLPRVRTEGVFAEEESKRLAKAFDQIIYSLAERRLDYLGRESVAEKRADIYEFPRELAKVRNQAIQLLVEMTRPTQLSFNPFLRGFYFSGVRPVVINEAVPVTARASAPASSGGAGATRMFTFAEKQGRSEVAPLQAVKSRRVAEWTFLPHLFTDVMLRDRVAFSSSHQSTRVDTLRRVLLVCAAVMCLFLSTALLVSFFNNRSLQNDVKEAASGLAGYQPTSDLPDLAHLQQLDGLRKSVALLGQYHEHPPLGYRFGLYAGDSILPAAKNLYFKQFQRMLLSPAQQRIVARLKQLPVKPSPADDFSEPYSSLKAYLITTSFPGKSTKDFLSPVLFNRWLGGRALDPDREKLARLQFDFYSDELRSGVPISSTADDEAVKQARDYLNSGGFDSIYQRVLFSVGSGHPAINFNRMYPNSAVLDAYEVPAAFTKEGFKAMQEVIRNPDKFFRGEGWVLGDQASPSLSIESLKQQLQDRYTNDYLNHWRTFIKSATVVRYGLQDAPAKLQSLSDGTSPLLRLFTLVGQHTSVESTVINNEFQPVQLVAGKPEQPISAGTQPYVDGLAKLGLSVAGFAATPPPGDPTPVIQAAGSARIAVNQVLATAHIDNQTHAPVQTLLLAPIVSAEDLARKRVPGTGPLCATFKALSSKFPFNPAATEEASLEEFKTFFQPGTGTVWGYYEANFKSILTRTGTEFTPTGPISVPRDFLAFLHRSAVITDALFPPGGAASASPHLTYTLYQPANNSVDKLHLEIDGKIFEGPAGKSLQLVWPGEGAQGAHLSGSSGGNQLLYPAYPGPWGVFHFFQAAKRWTPKGAGYELEWPLEYDQQAIRRPDGTPIIPRYELQGPGVQLFRKDFFQGMRCVAIGSR